jgi:uncharacterized paraquat-inducible protein A
MKPVLLTLLAWQLLCLALSAAWVLLRINDAISAISPTLFDGISRSTVFYHLWRLFCLATITTPATCVSVGLYGLLLRRRPGKTHCRHCGLVLWRLERPVCPRCAAPI